MTDLTETIRRVRESLEHERGGFREPGTGGGPWRSNASVARRKRAQAELFHTAVSLLADECERLRLENSDLCTSNAVNEHYCNKAMALSETAGGVIAGLTSKYESLRSENAELRAEVETLHTLAPVVMTDLRDRLKLLREFVCRRCECASVASFWNESLPLPGAVDMLCPDCAYCEIPDPDETDGTIVAACISVGMRALCGRKLLP